MQQKTVGVRKSDSLHLMKWPKSAASASQTTSTSRRKMRCSEDTATLTVMAPYTIMALIVSISREMANPTQAFSGGGKEKPVQVHS